MNYGMIWGWITGKELHICPIRELKKIKIEKTKVETQVRASPGVGMQILVEIYFDIYFKKKGMTHWKKNKGTTQ